MTLPTLSDLLKPQGYTEGVRALVLGTRGVMAHGAGSKDEESAGAIVQADGNMLVAPNGYPVLASVHMNASYFKTAQRNLVWTKGYQTNPNRDDYFDTGAFVVKATWLRLAEGEMPPLGAYTTTAQVPILAIDKRGKNVSPVEGKFVSAKVALLGLHVVGTTVNHPEFLWATFEHKLNSPRFDDNTFDINKPPNPKNYTLYRAGTPMSATNIANNTAPPILRFNEQTQRFTPSTNAVLYNKTGGENHSPAGPSNIANLNESAQTFLSNSGFKDLASYDLIGTVWLKPNFYTGKNLSKFDQLQTRAVGSVNLANSTAETFQQAASNQKRTEWKNCFSCHNTTVYAPGKPPLNPRRVAISHVLEVGTPYAVMNSIPIHNSAAEDDTAPKQ
ncbi:hypothetical protein KIK84_00230 [Curvibacter sp. CHRR-16]|uniref:hypothetical protein n=1 Tax=Curvibacter sp. CHRR-16 TaxID=2835872 RepID=UPI001BDB0D04|nr:hypothetical protein [Curvibacter sp. CHRR-16]MBT0568738.1 hypothetical protein [Curvibacter sp. CHRR-16]